MVPKKVWLGHFDANGGYLIVKEDGEILAYHIMELRTYENLLFNHSYVERPSTRRHGYGFINRDGDTGHLRFKLNLQIRIGWR